MDIILNLIETSGILLNLVWIEFVPLSVSLACIYLVRKNSLKVSKLYELLTQKSPIVFMKIIPAKC